jgi:hypothetical protein
MIKRLPKSLAENPRMKTSERITLTLSFCFAVFGTASGADGGDVCHCAPHTWQYNQDVCFGHYQTRWRRWDEACGHAVPASSAPINPVVVVAPTMHLSQKPKLTWEDLPPPPAATTTKSKVVIKSIYSKQDGPPPAPAAILLNPNSVPTLGAPAAALGEPR